MGLWGEFRCDVINCEFVFGFVVVFVLVSVVVVFSVSSLCWLGIWV